MLYIYTNLVPRLYTWQDRTRPDRITERRSNSKQQTANSIPLLCFCLYVSPSLTAAGTPASEVQLGFGQLNGLSFFAGSHCITSCSPGLLTTNDNKTNFSHIPLLSMETPASGPFGTQRWKNDYSWMWLCFRRYYSYHQETGRNEGAANAALDVISQILDILSHLLWERWDELLWISGTCMCKSELMDFMGCVSCVFMTP